MVRHRDMHHILGAPLRHVTEGAIRARGMRRRQFRGVAPETRGPVVLSGLLAAGNIVRVMTRGAAHGARAFVETNRLAQPVGRPRDLELAFMACAGRMVKMQLIVAQRLTGPVGKRLAPVPDHRIRQLEAGGFEVALQADFHLPLAAQPLGIHDGRLDFGGRPALLHGLHMRLARPMAALAIDPFGKFRGIDGIGANRAAWIAVVAEEAGVTHLAAEVLVRGAVVARAHPERAAIFHIPTHRQLDQMVVRGAMEVGPRMVAGTHYVVNLRLEDVSLLGIRPFLVAPLEIPLAAPDDRVVSVRRGVVVSPFGNSAGKGPRERPSHASKPIRLTLPGVATGADLGIGVSSLELGGGGTARPPKQHRNQE